MTNSPITVINSDLWVDAIKASQYWSLIYTTTYNIHAGAYETITIDGYGGSFITNADGNCTHALPIGELTLTGSVSRQSFTRMVTLDDTDVYVMPEGALYWYGNECVELTTGGYPGWDTTVSITRNTNEVVLTKSSSTSKYTSGAIISANTINISGYQKLCFKIKTENTNTHQQSYGLATNADELVYKRTSGHSCCKWFGRNILLDESIELDLSSLTVSDVYLYSPLTWDLNDTNDTITRTTYAIWLE